MSDRRLLLLSTTLIGAGLVVLLAVLLLPSGSEEADLPTGQAGDQTAAATLAEQDAEQADPIVEIGQTPSPTPPRRMADVIRAGQGGPESIECDPPVRSAPFVGYQILSYYGNPYRNDMGILGELEPHELVRRLLDHAKLYDSLNGPIGIQPALHLVYATAQDTPGPEGLYLMHVDDATLREYIELACQEGLLIFLDLQIAHSDVETELERILPYLVLEPVHVAIDPEWAMAEGQTPGEVIGSLDAADINKAQAMIERFVKEHDLSDKILIVHQFTDDMITNRMLIRDYPRVRLVIDMDGFGPAAVKRLKYVSYAETAEYSGIKLFFHQDPDLMSEQQVLELRPNVIIYQ
jgi:hypothetical protein